MDRTQAEVAQLAAQFIVDDGLPYGEAKRRASERLGLGRRAVLPDNDAIEDAVREHLAIFCGDTQPAELLALRREALRWLGRLSAACPNAKLYVTGAVWNGTATRLSDIHLQAFDDDSKAIEIALINTGQRYEVSDDTLASGERLPCLSWVVPCVELGETVGLHVVVHPLSDLYGGMRSQRRGQPVRGDAQALQALVDGLAPT